MALYAVLNGGAIVERREIPDWETYPTHKKVARDEKGDGGPVLRPLVFVGESGIESVAIEIDRVVITRTPAPPPVEVIRTAYLAAALAQIGKLAAVDAAVGGDPVLDALWKRATEMRRDDPDMAAVAKALSIDLDDVWTRARAIRAARGSGA